MNPEGLQFGRFLCAILCLSLFTWIFILNLQNNYTDRKLMKMLIKRTEANAKNFGLELFFIED